ncbi:MAG TPA: O-antigen ligase family protein [Candidatus Sulfotelmatobacter sp.]|nr:O-antigen ligase family protein [Candidatus Sulfotelmatobacter sp.]
MPTKKMTDADQRARSVRLGNILLYGTFAVLMFGPVAFGAVERWSMFVLEASSVLLTLVWLAKQWTDGELQIRWNPLYVPMAGFGVLILLQFVLRSSAYPHDTLSEALLYCAYAMLCFLSGQALFRSSQARKIAVMLALYGFVLAALALLQGVAPNGKLFWIRQPRLGGWIYGSYVNHNHYAGLMELLVPIPLVLSLSRLAEHRERMAAGVAAAIMVGTVFLSGSRGGMLAIVVELAILAAFLLQQRKPIQIAIGLAAFAIVLVGMLTWLGGKELTARVSSISTESRSEITGGTRLSIDRDAIRMFRNRPVLGWGLGAFPVVYPQFRSFYTNFFVNEAHNDYLQLLTEMGLLGFGIMVWFLIVLLRHAIPKIGIWTSDVGGAVTLACTLSVSGILVHSLFDFNLQIPANAALFYVFCTMAAAPPLLRRSRQRRPASPTNDEQLLPASEVV